MRDSKDQQQLKLYANKTGTILVINAESAGLRHDHDPFPRGHGTMATCGWLCHIPHDRQGYKKEVLRPGGDRLFIQVAAISLGLLMFVKVVGDSI